MTSKEQKLCVVVPWPHRYLSPNSRVNWPAKAQIVQKARMTSRLLAKELFKDHEPAQPVEERINVQLVLHPRDKRRRDEDNIIASMKAYLDGIADAMGVNDAFFHFKELEHSYIKKTPEIEVWLSWQEA